MLPDDVLRALLDPTAPLPHNWPTGVWGVFLLFLVPIGGGIPFGVLMARDAGIAVPITVFLYFVSDLVLAVTTEPLLAGLRAASRRVAFLANIGRVLGRFTGSAGLQEGGVRGPLGLILVAFSISPTTGRAAAAAAGHGFFSGWALAITGDMLYFGVLMISTLWVSQLLGDDRLTIGAVLIGTWVIPLVVRKLRGKRVEPVATAEAVHLRMASVPADEPQSGSQPTPLTSASYSRRRVNHSGRRRRASHR
jgi:hypothetical protein